MQEILARINKIDMYHIMITFLVILEIVGNLYLNFFTANNNQLLALGFFRILLIPLFGVLLDLIIKRHIKKRTLAIPKTAIISGLLVTGIIDISAPIIIPIIAITIAILSKHILRFSKRNIFNPAALGIVTTAIIFTYGLGINVIGAWWVATTLLVIPLGLYVSYRMRKLPLSITFIATYAIILLLAFNYSINSITHPIFFTTFFFFACFMLLEPRTSTITIKGMLLAGFCVGLLLAVLPIFVPAVEYVLVALLIINIFKGFLDNKFPNIKKLATKETVKI